MKLLKIAEQHTCTALFMRVVSFCGAGGLVAVV